MLDMHLARRGHVSSISCPVAATLLAGCASIPDVTVAYRPVSWSVQVAVAHTITCTRDDQTAVVQRGATFVPTYGAAAADPRFQIRLGDLSRYYADAELTLVLTEDGRLKSVNQSSTGQGESVVKTAIGAVAALAATSLPPPAPGAILMYKDFKSEPKTGLAQAASVCAVVRAWSLTAPNQLPQVSVVQTLSLKQATPEGGLPADPSKDQTQLLMKLKDVSLDLAAQVTATLSEDLSQPFVEPAKSVNSNQVPLTLQQIGTLQVSVTDQQGSVGARSISVPLKKTFVLPIPKAALFGKQSFALVLAESGKVTNIGYGNTTGVPGAFGAVTALAGAETAKDTAEVAALKAASDLIAQQQRFNTCRLNPTECK